MFLTFDESMRPEDFNAFAGINGRLINTSTLPIKCYNNLALHIFTGSEWKTNSFFTQNDSYRVTFRKGEELCRLSCVLVCILSRLEYLHVN